MLSTQLVIIQLYLDVENVLGDLVLPVKLAKHIETDFLLWEPAIEFLYPSR